MRPGPLSRHPQQHHQQEEAEAESCEQERESFLGEAVLVCYPLQFARTRTRSGVAVGVVGVGGQRTLAVRQHGVRSGGGLGVVVVVVVAEGVVGVGVLVVVVVVQGGAVVAVGALVHVPIHGQREVDVGLEDANRGLAGAPHGSSKVLSSRTETRLAQGIQKAHMVKSSILNVCPKGLENPATPNKTLLICLPSDTSPWN